MLSANFNHIHYTCNSCLSQPNNISTDYHINFHSITPFMHKITPSIFIKLFEIFNDNTTTLIVHPLFLSFSLHAHYIFEWVINSKNIETQFLFYFIFLHKNCVRERFQRIIINLCRVQKQSKKVLKSILFKHCWKPPDWENIVFFCVTCQSSEWCASHVR